MYMAPEAPEEFMELELPPATPQSPRGASPRIQQGTNGTGTMGTSPRKRTASDASLRLMDEILHHLISSTMLFTIVIPIVLSKSVILQCCKISINRIAECSKANATARGLN